MAEDYGAKISMVDVTVPIPATKPRPGVDPNVGLELWRDQLRAWHYETGTCGHLYHYADRAELASLPHLRTVFTHLLRLHARERGNPLGEFLWPAVQAMERALTEQEGSRVYFARSSNRIKIGWSRNVATRLAQLQTGNPDPVTLLAVVPGGRQLERRLHQQFAPARLTGEWFTATPDLIDYIAQAVAP